MFVVTIRFYKPFRMPLQCTISMVKALVFKGPRGYNTVCEADYFYTLPDKPDSLRPKRKHLKATSAIPTTTTPVPELHYDEHHHDHHAEFSHDDHYSSLFVPDSSWQDNPTDILAASSPVYPPSSKERLWQKYLHPKVTKQIELHRTQFNIYYLHFSTTQNHPGSHCLKKGLVPTKSLPCRYQIDIIRNNAVIISQEADI